MDASGLDELKANLQRSFKVDTSNKHATIAGLHQIGVSVLFGLYSSPDKDDSGHTMAHFSQSGLGAYRHLYYLYYDVII